MINAININKTNIFPREMLIIHSTIFKPKLINDSHKIVIERSNANLILNSRTFRSSYQLKSCNKIPIIR